VPVGEVETQVPEGGGLGEQDCGTGEEGVGVECQGGEGGVPT
jgi:hypothetical protein